MSLCRVHRDFSGSIFCSALSLACSVRGTCFVPALRCRIHVHSAAAPMGVTRVGDVRGEREARFIAQFVRKMRREKKWERERKLSYISPPTYRWMGIIYELELVSVYGCWKLLNYQDRVKRIQWKLHILKDIEIKLHSVLALSILVCNFVYQAPQTHTRQWHFGIKIQCMPWHSNTCS